MSQFRDFISLMESLNLQEYGDDRDDDGYDNEDEDEDDGPPAPDEYVLQKGTTVYHGTNAKFDERNGLDDFSWVTNSVDTAKYFSTWSDQDGKPRLITYTVSRPVRLAVLTRSIMDYYAEYEGVDDGNGMREYAMDLMQHLRRQGFEGWIIPDNYGTEQADILLADTSCLSHVKTSKL
jgi:hypothetical protein